MIGGHRRAYIASAFTAATLIAASIWLYRIRPVAGITFGSAAVVLAVLAHLGIIAAVVAPLVAWRRRVIHRDK